MTTGLRHLAEKDLGRIMEGSSSGFGWPIVVTNPLGQSVLLTGMSSDVSQMIDVDTGQVISGRTASVSIRIGLLIENGFAIPESIADENSKPWLISFDDINGNPYVFKVAKSNPDRAIGTVSCMLELYQP